MQGLDVGVLNVYTSHTLQEKVLLWEKLFFILLKFANGSSQAIGIL